MRPFASITESRSAGRLSVSEPSAKSILAAYGLDVPRGITVPPGADPELRGLAGPFAAKLISPALLHKSDVGGVRLHLHDATAARVAVRELERVAANLGLGVDGVLVEEMVPKGIELVIGGTMDVRFGPLIMLGLGGIFVEVLRDTAFALCPITERDAQDMIDSLQGATILRGARGGEKVNIPLLVSTLLSVGGEDGLLVQLQGEIAELDINPLMASAERICACDARIVLQPPVDARSA